MRWIECTWTEKWRIRSGRFSAHTRVRKILSHLKMNIFPCFNPRGENPGQELMPAFLSGLNFWWSYSFCWLWCPHVTQFQELLTVTGKGANCLQQVVIASTMTLGSRPLQRALCLLPAALLRQQSPALLTPS